MGLLVGLGLNRRRGGFGVDGAGVNGVFDSGGGWKCCCWYSLLVVMMLMPFM